MGLGRYQIRVAVVGRAEFSCGAVFVESGVS